MANNEVLSEMYSYSAAVQAGYNGTEEEYLKFVAEWTNANFKVLEMDLGAVSAYALAKEQGYTGTEEEFGILLANAGNNALAAQAAKEAAEAAQAAAETARDRAGDVAYGLPVRIDEAQTLTDAEKQTGRNNIDAASTGDVTDLKSDLKDNIKSVFNAFNSSEDHYITEWVQGTIEVADGTTKNANNRCRSSGYVNGSAIGPNGYALITVKDGYKLSVRQYNTDVIDDPNRYEGVPYNGFKVDNIIIPINADWYYRFVIALETDDALTPEQIPADALKYTVYELTDKTLTSPGKAADAEVTGGKFNDLERYIPYTNYYNVKCTSWYKGTINKNTGITESSNTRCRSGGYIFGADLFYDGKAIIKVKDGYKANVFAYNKPGNEDGLYEGILFDALQSGLIIINENTEQHASRDFYYRIIIGKTDNSNISPSDIPSDAIITYGGKRELPTVATTQTGVDRYITRFTIPVNIAPYGETKNVVDYRCVIQLPGTYKANGDPTPLIMIGHGGTGYVSDSGWNDSSNFRSMVDDFCGAGYAVFDVNNTIDDVTGTTVADEGCLTLMQAYIGAWEFIKKHYNVSDKLYIVSNSMGTFAAMNMLKWYGSNINTAVLCGPRVSIAEVYARMDTTNREHLAYVFGWGSTPAADQYDTVKDLMYGWDNYLDIYTENNIKKINRHFPPIKVMVGANDTNGLTEVREYFPALNRSGNIVEYKEVSGADHGAICNLTPEGTRAEVIEWLNRFSGLN